MARLARVEVFVADEIAIVHMMNQTLDHVWNSEVALAAIWFFDGLAPSGARYGLAIEKLLFDHGPAFATVVRKVVNCDPVGARGSVVQSNFVPGFREIVRVNNFLH